jgi:hypothetical protein
VILQGRKISLKQDIWTSKRYLRFILSLRGSRQVAQAIPKSLANIWNKILKINQTRAYWVFSILLMIRLDWKTWKIQSFLKFLQFFSMFKTVYLKTHLVKSIKNYFHIFWKMSCKWQTVKKIHKNKWAEKILQINCLIKQQMMSKQIWTNKNQINAAQKNLKKY